MARTLGGGIPLRNYRGYESYGAYDPGLRRGMPQPYGAYDPSSGSPRMDLWFRKILADMQGIKDIRATQVEAEREASLEERGMRVEERGVEVKEAKEQREGQPMIWPPEILNEITKYHGITPESFQGLNKKQQITMFGVVAGEAGREKSREFQAGQETKRIQRQEDEARYEALEVERLRQVIGDTAIVRTARSRLEKERTRLIQNISSANTRLTSPKRQMYTKQLENIDAAMKFLGEADVSLADDTPLGPDRKGGVKALLGDISKVRDGSALENLISIMPETQEPAGAPVVAPGGETGKELDTPEDGTIRTVESGKYKGMTVIYDAEKGRWFPYEGEEKIPFVSPKLRGR